MLKKESAAIYVALITGLAGISTSLVNRFDPSEPAAEATYEVTKKSFANLVDDLDSMQSHIDELEHNILKQCLKRIRTSRTTEPNASSSSNRAIKPKRKNRRRRRSKMPSYRKAQQQQAQ